MAKNVLPKHWNGSEFEELHIVTKASNVLTEDNKSVQQKMDDFTAHLAETAYIINVLGEGVKGEVFFIIIILFKTCTCFVIIHRCAFICVVYVRPRHIPSCSPARSGACTFRAEETGARARAGKQRRAVVANTVFLFFSSLFSRLFIFFV